jgi:hypothetical protein
VAAKRRFIDTLPIRLGIWVQAAITSAQHVRIQLLDDEREQQERIARDRISQATAVATTPRVLAWSLLRRFYWSCLSEAASSMTVSFDGCYFLMVVFGDISITQCRPMLKIEIWQRIAASNL